MADLAVLTTVPSAALAQPLLDFLADNGITGHMQPADMGAFYPALNFSNGTNLLVAERDLKRAQELYEAFVGPGPTGDIPLETD